MKTNLKKTILSALILTLSSLSALGADGLSTYNIPAPFPELSQRMQMSSDFIDQLRPFANGLEHRLKRILVEASDHDLRETERYLLGSLKSIVKNNKEKFSESLAIEVLERATLIHNILKEETDSKVNSVLQMRVRLLTRAIELAREKFLKIDQEYLSSFENIDYFRFGLDYADYIYNLNKSIFDASAQYRMERLRLAFLRYDFARDLHFQSYGTQIIEVSDVLEIYPDKYAIDQSSLIGVRRLRARNKLILDSLNNVVNHSAKIVLYRGSLISGDNDSTMYIGKVESTLPDGQLSVNWYRRSGHQLASPFQQSHNIQNLTFENRQNRDYMAGQIVSQLDFNTNGTRFTRSGRLVHLFSDGTAEVNWTHATGFGLANGQSSTKEDKHSSNTYLPLSQLN